jgi:hypothetical protein
MYSNGTIMALNKFCSLFQTWLYSQVDKRTLFSLPFFLNYLNFNLTIMGAKTFNNQTGRRLLVTLTVRRGELPPGNEADVKNFTLEIGASNLFTYSGDDNPKLDGIEAVTDDNDELSGDTFSHEIHDQADLLLNWNNTVTFSLQGPSIVLGFQQI